MPHFLLLLDLSVSLFIYFLCRFLRPRSPSHFPMPPGPKTSWIGRINLPRLDDYPWKTYAGWRDIYGDVIYVHVLGNPIIVLNSREAIRDLFEKRSHNYSSRKIRPMLNELMGWDWIFSSMPYGDTWRKHRRLFHKYFHPAVSPRYRPIQIKETNTLLLNLFESPEQFARHVRRTSAAIVMMISYGYQIAPEGDKYVSLADEALSTLGRAGVFGTFLVDYLPFLKYVPAWMPGASFKRKAAAWRKLSKAMNDWPYDMLKRSMAAGNVVPSLAASELEALAQKGDKAIFDEQTIQNVSGISYAAGADTTVAVILCFILAMTLYPEVQLKALAELDQIVGSSRLPSFEDRDKLPYIEAIVYESLRWNPVLPLGLSHKAIEDDVYRGMYIPADAMIMPNVWAILHDEEDYPDPMEFRPERFVGTQPPGVNEYPVEAFGFGRRICPGRYLAENTIWIAIARIVALFNISKAVDENGKVVEAAPEFTASNLSRPKPFKCNFTLRSENAAVLLREAVDNDT